MYESLYVHHRDFNPNLNGWIDWQIEPKLVRSIEAWCHHQIYPIIPITPDLIRDRVAVKQHFDRWFVEVKTVHQLDRSSIIESLFQDLLTRLRQQPQDEIVKRHWMAFFMHRCTVIGWKIWQMMPQQWQSFHLFQEIIACSYSQIGNLHDSERLLANFTPGKSKLVSGVNHIKAFIDRQIKFSIYPYLRELCGDPNLGRTNLGVAARHRRSEINQALQCLYAPDQVSAYLLLWQCFDLYKRETGIAVNRLTASDFEEIGKIQHRLASRHDHQPLCDLEVKRQLDQIGSAMRNYLLRQPLALDSPIQTDDNSTSFSDTTADRRQDLLEALAHQETWQVLQLDLLNFFQELPPANSQPSHQQLFWLRYGLDLKQKQIGEILQLNFKLTKNPGSVSLRLHQGHNYLFQRIHTALQSEPAPLTKQEIDITMGELLKTYFDRVIPSLLGTVATKLNLPAKLWRSSDHQAEFIAELTIEIEQRLNLCLPSDITSTSLPQSIDRFFRA